MKKKGKKKRDKGKRSRRGGERERKEEGKIWKGISVSTANKSGRVAFPVNFRETKTSIHPSSKT